MAIKSNVITNKQQTTWLRSSVRIALFNMSAVVIVQSDVLILYLTSFFNHAIKTNHQTSIFAVANVISQILWLIVSNAYNHISPLTSSYFKNKTSCDKLNKMIGKSTIVAITLISVLFIGILIYGNKLLGHFGEIYRNGYTTLILLCVAPVISILTGYSTNGLKYTGNEKEALRIAIYGLLIFYLLCPILTALYGMNGTAISDIIIWTFIGSASNIILKRKTYIKPWGF